MGDEKLILMAMSMGTLVSVHTVLSQQHELAGLVLLALAVSLEMTPRLRFIKLVGNTLTCLRPLVQLVPAVKKDFKCQNPLVNQELDSDPLTSRKAITCRMGKETLACMTALQHDKAVDDPSNSCCQIPLLMMMASQDKVTSLPVARNFYERIATTDKQVEGIDGAFHVVLEELEKERVVTCRL